MAESFASLGRVEAIRILFENSGYSPFGEPLFFEEDKGSHSVSASSLFLEGIDFNLEYFPLKHLGSKCVLAQTGELYAVLAEPRTLSITLGVSAKLDFPQISELWSGMLVAAREFGYKQLSLDLVPSKNGLTISVNAAGSSTGKAADRRPIAESKDLICVSGRMGAAYLGQQVLERKPGELEKYKMMVGAYLKPELDADVLRNLDAAGITPSFGYFVRRCLADTLLRLHRDSGLGVKVYAERIPFEGNSFSLGKEMNIDPVSAAMNGGDDCCLLFTVPIAKFDSLRKNFPTFELIGHLALPEVGSVLVTPDGLEHEISAQGWV